MQIYKICKQYYKSFVVNTHTHIRTVMVDANMYTKDKNV